MDKLKRKAGKIGGARRAEILPPERRADIARRAAQSRWGSKPAQATHGSEDHPLTIGDIEIPCYVLENDIRVLTQGGFTSAVGMARGGSMIAGMNRLQLFVGRKGISPFISNELVERIANPIPFFTPTGGRAYGFEATLLADVCEAVLKAREAGALQMQQRGIAAKCEILVRGFARVGIIALVDEARHNGRHYLHNGFHRCLALRRAGATHAPCILRDVPDHAAVGIHGGTFSPPLLESANPPTLGHFTQGRAYDVQLKNVARYLHVSWAEYVVADE